MSSKRNSVILPEHRTQTQLETRQQLNIFDISTCTLSGEDNRTPKMGFTRKPSLNSSQRVSIQTPTKPLVSIQPLIRSEDELKHAIEVVKEENIPRKQKLKLPESQVIKSRFNHLHNVYNDSLPSNNKIRVLNLTSKPATERQEKSKSRKRSTKRKIEPIGEQ